MKKYWPLLALILIAILAAFAIIFGITGNFHDWMHYFMGILFCQFALLKLFDLPSFADGFQMYDLLGKKSRTYALLYPFIELALGLAYLSFFMPIVTYAFTTLMLFLGALGVLIALKQGLKTNCACMGTSLQVPLSTVTLSEDIGMGVISLFMLLSMASS